MLLQTVIVVHIAAGLTAVIAGFAAMLAPKRPGRHPHRGRTYLIALTVLACTAAVLVTYRPHTAYLLILAGIALTAAGLGYAARRRHRRGWLAHHITLMAVSYITMLTAFYVDNGPRLPLWNLLPPITFWFLPAAVGTPLLLRALRKHTPHHTPVRPPDHGVG